MSIVHDAIVEELQTRMKKSVDYKQQIDTAKTKIKRKILSKRLKKNNEIVAELMKSLEAMNKTKENSDA